MNFPPVPELHYPTLTSSKPYQSSHLRAPHQTPLRIKAPFASEHSIDFSSIEMLKFDADLTKHGKGEPIGERIAVHGQITDEDGKPVRNSLVEVWQCNAAGRYWHAKDQHNAPLDPNFFGAGKFLTDDQGRYQFITIKPGAYPWGNHDNAWRPAHIHFSLFGNVLAQRLVTQMYFPGDPLHQYDPIMHSVPTEAGRQSMISRLSLEHTVSGERLAYVFDIVLRGKNATAFIA